LSKPGQRPLALLVILRVVCNSQDSRDPLSIELYTRKVAFQKLDYIHANPLAERWNLCKAPEDYAYSLDAFYKSGIDKFGFLKDIRDEF